MGYECIVVRSEGPAAVITLNLPEKYNAFTPQMIGELVEALVTLGTEAQVRGIVLTGHPKFFSTGGNLSDTNALGSDQGRAVQLKKMQELTDAIEQSAKPVIAAISGWCLTSGLGLAMTCDLRVADETAKFGITSSKIGTVPSAGVTQRLPRLVGPAKAKELLFSADFIDAAEAYRIGLINRLVPPGEAAAEAERMISVYVERGPISLQLLKQAVNVGMQMDLRAALEYEAKLMVQAYDTEDRVEGSRAFQEKRKPVFKGR